MKQIGNALISWPVAHYKWVTAATILFAVVCGSFIPLIKVDTDPENMLSPDEPVRLFNTQTKLQFGLNDIVVLGIINETHPVGVFNPKTLSRIYELTEFAKTLRWPDKDDPTKTVGVIEVDIIAPSLVDHMEQSAPGVITFEWLMQNPPETQAEALEIRDRALRNPLLKGTMVSEDGKAICVYLPLTDKHLSYRVYTELNKKIAAMGADEKYYITGLPVAEDTFGVEMFIQMAVAAPLAMLTIFILMFIFIRKLSLVISPMIVAMVSVISTMGLMIGMGYPVHIMSSMIPIFLMPISVVDSVHVLSEFFDRYNAQKGRRKTIIEVMDTLFVPMLYTSLTSAAGFLSLALTPIPPVQVFGVFVAVGIMLAWVFTIAFVPAYVMFIPDRLLENFGHAVQHEIKETALTRILRKTGVLTVRWAKPILTALAVCVAVSAYGISRIEINDNPVKWFSTRHPIRIADIALNKHFGGTYMAYLVLDSKTDLPADAAYRNGIVEGLLEKVNALKADYPSAPALAEKLAARMSDLAEKTQTQLAFLDAATAWIDKQTKAASDDDYDAWDELRAWLGVEKARLNVFKRPDVLRYMADLQAYLESIGRVGKSSSVADVVRKVNQELIDGQPENYRIPDNLQGVAECYLQFQQSHRPGDLWHLVTPDYQHANIWVQLTSGDNKDMESVIRSVDAYFESHTPPVPLDYRWAGQTYLNTVWQDKMVWGMLQSFLGSFLVVYIMMSVLFRSPWWGLLCMVPLTITIVVIYGVIGLTGKDYDMPVAVLSALTLGMAVDFAIHFLQRCRSIYNATGSWQKSAPEMFGEPARAISRNVLVIAIGFLPLLAAPLMPYKTVGIFLCAIMAISGVVTLLALPAIITVAAKHLFKKSDRPESATCNCGFCLTVSIVTIVLIALNLHQYWQIGITRLTMFSLLAIPILILTCGLMARRKACKTESEIQNKKTKTAE